MRAIQISLDVFQAIWTQRLPGEPNEDAVLRRILLSDGRTQPPTEMPKSAPSRRDMHPEVGFNDLRYGVLIPPGFEILRTYKGQEFRAQAQQGFWILGKDGRGYGTLNELNGALGIGHENAWKAWFYLDNSGRKRPLSDLRDQSRIVRRSKPTVTDLLVPAPR